MSPKQEWNIVRAKDECIQNRQMSKMFRRIQNKQNEWKLQYFNQLQSKELIESARIPQN